ncbi:myb-binding protein 1A-like protein [Uloborus diversus]|uniref:myb-binding protein 1A-like protein n=1 Tax=Uloborus diversus TaxID=327109 RepID=UPI002408FF58|nr:myb-binding protein 1A-like protein [Uloborus diversus]
MDETEVKSRHIDKNILDLFWSLSNKKPEVRVKACANIFRILLKKQNEVDDKTELCSDLKYSLERLVKGLASPREAARLGYTLLLTEVLREFDVVEVEQILDFIKQYLPLSGKLEKKDATFGQLFAFTAIIRSERIINHSHLSFVFLSLFDLSVGKHYISNVCYEVSKTLYSQLSPEKFKEALWPLLKQKLSCGWEQCSMDVLWLLLLSHRFFMGTVNSKYLKKHWGGEDLFSSDNFPHHKRLIKQTTVSLPVLHPLCLEFLEIVKERNDMKEIWNAVIDENLFDELNEKAVIGFEMIKKVVPEIKKKKKVKSILSQKFASTFIRGYINPKHALNAAATSLAEFFSTFVKTDATSEVQIIILKVFLQLPGNGLLDQILKKKEVSAIIQNLSSDAIKAFCEILKLIALQSKLNNEEELEENENCLKSIQAVNQIGNLTSHPVIIADIEWRLNMIKFLFLHSFFTVKEPTSEIAHCDTVINLTSPMQKVFMNTFYRALDSLHHRTENQSAPFEMFIQQLVLLSDYADQLLSADEYVTPIFSVQKIEDSWKIAKSMVHKLTKQGKKDGKLDESNAFQSLFLQLSFLLFNEDENTTGILEELHICCKKALSIRKHGETSEDEENEPPWVAVVIDILLSLLSKSSHHLRCLVSSVFPLFCPFVTAEALQQILDVIHQEKSDESILVEESDEDEKDLDFNSGSSSEDDDDKASNDAEAVDEEFRKKVKEALGAAAEISDADSVVLSDSEMFKVDDALSKAFKARAKSGHTKLNEEDKTLLHFRIRCLDLITAFLKSEPPMQLVLQCIEPLVAAFEHGHRGKHQKHLLYKTVSAIQVMTAVKKYKSLDEVQKSELKRILEILVAKSCKEVDMTVANKLYSLCIFVVLCFRKLQSKSSPEKKASKLPTYMKIYLSALDAFVKESKNNLYPQFFTSLMEACPDLAWDFVEPCKNYAFADSTRMYKKTQCLGLIFEAMKYSKAQQSISTEKWLQFGKELIPLSVENLKTGLSNDTVKPLYLTELLNVIYSVHTLVKEKTNQLLLKPYAELVPLLSNMKKKDVKRIAKKGKLLRNQIILCLGGSIKKEAIPADEDTGKVVNSEEEEKAASPDKVQFVNELDSSKKKKSKSPKKKKKIKLENTN